MTIEFSTWPDDRVQHYRAQGYWLDQPLTQILRANCASRPQAPAIFCGERVFSYEDVDRMSSNLATHLVATGLGKGDTALVQLPNVAEFYLVFFALLKAGVVPVNALYNHRQHELTEFARQVEPRLLIASRRHEVFHDDKFVNALQSLKLKPDCILILGSARDQDNCLSDWLNTAAPNSTEFSPVEAGEIAFFLLSGGSSGTPKLIPRTHNDYAYCVRASAEICRLTPDTRYLCALPAGHNFTLGAPGALGTFRAGGCVILAASPNPSECFALIKRHAVTVTALVPSAVALWLETSRDRREDLISLQLLQVGGAVFDESMARSVPGELGCGLQQVFGMAEGLISCTRLDEPDESIFTTQGSPISAGDELKIVDGQGRAVPSGTPGALAVRGPYTICGYFRSPEHNSVAFDVDGYYYSGDLVEQTSGGNLRVVGRIKDQINRGGEKIASEEIETLIATHPDVIHAAVIAVPDEVLGEKTCAFIVSREPALGLRDLRRHLSSLGVAEYKLPDLVRKIEAIPLTAMGKIDKRRLRDLLEQQPTNPAVESGPRGLHEWLEGRLLQLLPEIDRIDPEENLIFYGLDSLRLMQLAAELKRRGVQVSLEELARAPMLARWWALLETRKGGAP